MKFSALAAAFLTLPALALAGPLETRQTNSSCTTGSMQCCQSTYKSDSIEGVALLEKYTRDTGKHYSGSGDVGVGCSSLLGATCTAAPICCDVSAILAALCLPIVVTL